MKILANSFTAGVRWDRGQFNYGFKLRRPIDIRGKMDELARALKCRWKSRPQYQTRILPKSFNHLVGAADHGERDSEVERLGGLHVYDQFDFCCLLNR
jgi:hypothetical protein